MDPNLGSNDSIIDPKAGSEDPIHGMAIFLYFSTGLAAALGMRLSVRGPVSQSVSQSGSQSVHKNCMPSNVTYQTFHTFQMLTVFYL